MNTGKASRLVEANEYIYGINREPNPYYGIEIYHEEANQGDATAACYLGHVYEEGVLLPKDLIKSSKYYQKAIQGKQTYAYYRYAMALIEGELSDRGVNAEHLKKGFDLLQEAISGDNAVILFLFSSLKLTVNWDLTMKREGSHLIKLVFSPPQ